MGAESTGEAGHICLSADVGGGDSVISKEMVQMNTRSSCRKIPLLASVEGPQLLHSCTVGDWMRRGSEGDGATTAATWLMTSELLHLLPSEGASAQPPGRMTANWSVCVWVCESVLMCERVIVGGVGTETCSFSPDMLCCSRGNRT